MGLWCRKNGTSMWNADVQCMYYGCIMWKAQNLMEGFPNHFSTQSRNFQKYRSLKRECMDRLLSLKFLNKNCFRPKNFKNLFLAIFGETFDKSSEPSEFNRVRKRGNNEK